MEDRQYRCENWNKCGDESCPSRVPHPYNSFCELRCRAHDAVCKPVEPETKPNPKADGQASKPGAIVIKTRKIVQGGLQFREILSIEGVKTDLPALYTEPPLCKKGDARCLMSGNYLSVNFHDGIGFRSKYAVRPGTRLLEPEFADVLSLIRQAGERLHKINQEIKRKEALSKWSGEETFCFVGSGFISGGRGESTI